MRPSKRLHSLLIDIGMVTVFFSLFLMVLEVLGITNAGETYRNWLPVIPLMGMISFCAAKLRQDRESVDAHPTQVNSDKPELKIVK